MKKILLVLLIILGVCFSTGCKKRDNKTENTGEVKTIATILSNSFKTEIKKEKDIEQLAQKIAENDAIIPEVQTFSISKDDYLSGFKEEIKGFKKAYGIAPMIGTIPFIAYVFEVDNPDQFSKTLKENAQLDWNICTKADEMKTTIVDNYIFFVMSPTNFEQ